MSDERNSTTDRLSQEIEREKEECRRIAKRDGVPLEWLELIFAKMERPNVH